MESRVSRHTSGGKLSLPLHLGTQRQRQQFVRPLSISDRLKVVAVRARCDDHVKPKPSSFLDVAHVSPVLDVLNGLVQGHYPMTAVWLGIRPRFKIVESSRTVPLCVSCPSVHRRQQWQVRPVLRSAGWIIKRNVGRLRVANSPR